MSSERPLLRTPFSQRNPMREIAEAPSPMGVNLSRVNQRCVQPCPERCHRAGQPLRPDTTVRVLTPTRMPDSSNSKAPDLLPLKQFLHPKSESVLPKGLQRWSLISDHCPGFLHPVGSRQHQNERDSVHPATSQHGGGVSPVGLLPPANHLVKRRFTQMRPKLRHLRGIASGAVQQHIAR